MLIFINFIFHFSWCRSLLLSLHSRCLCHPEYWSTKLHFHPRSRSAGKRERKQRIFHLPRHSKTQPQGTGWMSWTIRVNDKSDVVHSFGKHSHHKRETGRQTLTCPELIKCVEANTHTHTPELVDMLRQWWEYGCPKLCYHKERKEKNRFPLENLRKGNGNVQHFPNKSPSQRRCWRSVSHCAVLICYVEHENRLVPDINVYNTCPD